MNTITQQPTTFRRKPFILVPGDPLILDSDPIDVILDFGRFVEETGIPATSMMTSRLCSLPIPLGEIRGWSNVRPETAWLPLLWLPPHLSKRKQYIINGDGLAQSVSPTARDTTRGQEVYEESDETWMIRVMLELTASGFYDADSGTWLDVLDIIGIDVGTDEGRRRVAAWLAGAPDEDLDLFDTGLELEGNIKSVAEPDWALNESIVNHGYLVTCAYCTGARSLSAAISELKDDIASGDASIADAKLLIETTCIAAATWFSDLPLADDDDVEAKPEDAWWLELNESAAAFQGDTPAFIGGFIDPAIERLNEIYEATLPLVENYLAG